jgi:hypothetical protein
MTVRKLFDPYTVDQQAIMLANHMPQGRIWANSYNLDSNMGKLIFGLGVEMYRLEVLTQSISKEIDINQANNLLIEWEKSVGIPDSCFSNTVSIEERRKQVLAKFSKFGGVQTAGDFVRAAAIFGFNIRVSSGWAHAGFPLVFPIMFADSRDEAVHVIVVELLDPLDSSRLFPLPFPIPFSNGASSFLQCIFDKLAPGNVKVVFTD